MGQLGQMKLVCGIVGVAGSVFSVQVESGESVDVDDLKEAIQKKKPSTFQCEVDDLQLFLAKTKCGAWLPQSEVKKGVSDTSQLTPLDVVGAPLHLVGLSEEEVRIQVTKEDVAAGKVPVHVLVAARQLHQALVPSVETVPTKKRKLAELSEFITLSSFAKCKGGGSWVKRLKKFNGQIECHRVERSDDSTPIPIVLLNETFARFEDNCKRIKVGQKDCEFVANLYHGLSTPYDSEAELAAKARELLTEYLLASNPVSTITPATVNGSVSDGSYRFGETLLLNLECKLQKGEGGGDPTMQNVAYYIKNLPGVIDRQFPCFLVDICGPLISVFGIVNTGDEDAICEPLVMSFPLIFYDNDWLMMSLTRMCASLKIAVQELTDECYKFSAGRQNRAALCATPLDRLRFPYKDSVEFNGAEISFQYVAVVQRYVFKAYHAGNTVIVKFAKRYGKEVHEYCSNAGFAPELLFYDSLPNGWVFIVMEQLSLVPLRQADGTTVCCQLRKIKDTLKGASFVHGDLRENNVMWDRIKNRVVLIDFDWSGKDGVDTYPPFMNAEIAWPAGAEYGKLLQVSHDAYWFDSIAAHLT